jgi:hypothetical protein
LLLEFKGMHSIVDSKYTFIGNKTALLKFRIIIQDAFLADPSYNPNTFSGTIPKKIQILTSSLFLIFLFVSTIVYINVYV